MNIIGTLQELGLLSPLLVTLTALGTAFVTRLFGKKKHKLEVEQMRNENVKSMVELNNLQYETMKQRIEDLVVDQQKERLERKEVEQEWKTSLKEALLRETHYLKKIKVLDKKISENNEQIMQLETKLAQIMIHICFVSECNDRTQEDNKC